jgi:hypothetical protein
LLLLGRALAAQATAGATYHFLPAHSDTVEAVIRQATARMNFVTRPIARSRLRQTNAAYRHLAIDERADSIAISYEGRAPIRAPSSGAATPWRREDGEQFQVWIQRDGDVLRHHFKADDGERLNEFRWSVDGDTLALSVTLTSSRLPEPVRYRLLYLRHRNQESHPHPRPFSAPAPASARESAGAMRKSKEPKRAGDVLR